MKFLATAFTAVSLILPTVVHAENAADWIRDTLNSSRGSVNSCSAEQAAIEGTSNRIKGLNLPDTGKIILVNIASGVVTAYLNGEAVIESKAVVGKKGTPTPELDNHVTFVRPNPTWTVPQSIIAKNGWREKLARDPQFFVDNNFDVILDGKTVNAFDAQDRAAQATTFVQEPGENNALGAVKIGLDNNQAIYLHDTNDPGKFEDAVRSASHGCVRVEQVRDLAAWVLGIPVSDMNQMIANVDTENHKPPEPVRVVIGYWTAWPDEGGTVRFYPDIYAKDRGQCGNRSSAPDNSDDDQQDQPPTPQRSERPSPRYEPDSASTGSNGNPEPVWTEYKVR